VERNRKRRASKLVAQVGVAAGNRSGQSGGNGNKLDARAAIVVTDFRGPVLRAGIGPRGCPGAITPIVHRPAKLFRRSRVEGAARSAMQSLSRRIGRGAFRGTMVLGALLMAWASGSYVELGEAHPFYLEKLPLTRPSLYLAALYAHVPSALFALPACVLLDTETLRSRWPGAHRWLGRLTAFVVLLLVVPSGLYLATFAQGGLVTTLGFWLTGLVSAGAMLLSVRAARRGRYALHRRFARHVTAQLSVAVLSRALLYGVELLELYEPWVYVAALWLPVLGALFSVEWLHAPRRSLITKGTRHEALAAVRRVDAVR
jgi:Predicted membrane protein (DUF2306)